MPFVSRTSLQGNFFKKTTEPTDWTNADLWADSDASPRSLFINNNGTALQLGSAALNQTVEGTIAAGALVVTLITINSCTDASSASYTTIKSITFTPTKATNTILVVGFQEFLRKGAGTESCFAKITEGGVDIIAEETATVPAADTQALFLMGSKTNVSAVAHTYDLQVKMAVGAGANYFLNGSLGVFEVS
jgi:hypothetical protein